MRSIVEHVRSIVELQDDEVAVRTSSYTPNGQTEIHVSSGRPLPEPEGDTVYVAISATISSSDPEAAAAEAEWLRGVLLERRRAT